MVKGEKVEGGYLLLEKTDVFSKELCDKIRKRLKLTEKDLSDTQIRKTTNLSNKLIGEWILSNSDGFKLKNNGVLAVSKYLPKCFSLDKDGTIESINSDPKKPQYIKDMFTKRLEKAMSLRKNFSNNTLYSNVHSFLYTYRVMWFNKKNCDFDKATVYEFEASRWMYNALYTAVVKGRNFLEYTFNDFVGKQFAPTNKRKRKGSPFINAHLHD